MTEGPNPGHPNEQAGPGVPPGGAAPPPPPYGGYGTYGSYGAYGGGASGGQGAYGPPGAERGYGAYGGGPYGGGPYGRPSAPKPGLVPLRPLTLGEILDGAFTAIRWNPKTILASSAVVATVSAVLVALVSYVVQRWALTNVHVSGSSTQLNTAAIVALVAVGGITAIVVAFANLILTGLLTVTVGQGVVGRKETLASAWQAARPRIWRLIGMLLLAAVFLVGGWLLAIGLSVLVGVILGEGAHLPAVGILVGVVCGLTAWVFSVIVLVRWSVAIPVVMLERKGPLKSLGRSWRLVRRSSWRVFGVLLVTELVVGIAAELINAPFAAASGGFSALTSHAQQVNVGGLFLTAVGQIIASTLTAPLLAGVIVLLYADLRMRREGLDITLQAAAAGAPDGARPDGQTASPW
jgi:Membrane domain of glycerophosphoryl diester phosphodiesterase